MTTTEHLRELLAKATPPPWRNQTPITPKNAAFAIALVNAAPALLDVVEAARKYAAYQSDIQSLRDSIAKLDEVTK